MKNMTKKLAAVFTAAAMTAAAAPINAFAQTAAESSVTVEYLAGVAKPSYMIKGTPGKRTIKLSCSTSGATIYYTTDGSTPTAKSKKYTGTITIKKDTKIRAVAIKGGTKSAVMTKTVRVKTLLGDATGNGTVDSVDYARFKKYRSGDTSYVCKDNCDVDGNGKLTSADLKILKLYIDGDIESFDEKVSLIDMPEITVYKAYGGKRFLIECDDDDAVIYYTTDGSTPDRKDEKYTGKFLVDEDTTVKAVAYVDGEYSEVKTRSVTVDRCDAPYADKNTDEEYQESVKITLDCDTANSRIYYTTDGKDPIKFGRLYKEPIELTENTTLKIASQAKGYADSKVVTYDYRVKSSFYSISGFVWDDSTLNPSDGKYQNGENGISGITVNLLNTATNKYEQTVTTDYYGRYIFNKVKPGNKYKVVFQFNGQKYRPFASIVSGGNQAVLTAALPSLIIKNGGAYSSTGSLLTAINNYASAISNGFYTSYASTGSAYTSEAKDVNMALRSDVFGSTSLDFVSTKITSGDTGATSDARNGSKVYANDIVNYTLRVTNNSETQTLKAADIMLYLNNGMSIQGIKCSDGRTATYSYEGTDNRLDTTDYVISCPEIAPKKTYDFIITAKVDYGVKNAAQLVCFADITAYSYKDSCYDKFSIPGNFSGSVREKDEAAAPTVYGYESVTDSQTIKWAGNNDFNTPIPNGTSRIFIFNIENGTSVNDYNVYVSDPGVIAYVTSATPTATGVQCILAVTGKKAGSSNIVVTLKKDSTKYIDCTVNVV